MRSGYSRQDDMAILDVLDLHDHEGLSNGQIAKRTGRSRSSISGILARFKHESEAGAGDRTMPRRWWA